MGIIKATTTPRPELEAEAREVAHMIHDDFTLQIGEPVSYRFDVEWLVCMETHIAEALIAAHGRGRAEGLEAAAQVAEAEFEHTCEWEECCADVRADDIAQAIRALGGLEGRS